ATTLAIVEFFFYARFVHTNVAATIASDYIRTARAKGAPPERLYLVHALRNALIPIVTVLGLDIASLMGGLVLTETVFNWPGLGRALAHAIRPRCDRRHGVSRAAGSRKRPPVRDRHGRTRRLGPRAVRRADVALRRYARHGHQPRDRPGDRARGRLLRRPGRRRAHVGRRSLSHHAVAAAPDRAGDGAAAVDLHD